jgi:hypothetical protein
MRLTPSGRARMDRCYFFAFFAAPALAAARRSVFLRREARFLTLSLPWLFPIGYTLTLSPPVPNDFAKSRKDVSLALARPKRRLVAALAANRLLSKVYRAKLLMVAVVMAVMPIMMPSVGTIPTAAAHVMAMNPMATVTVAGNPNPSVPLVPVVRPVVISLVAHAD